MFVVFIIFLQMTPLSNAGDGGIQLHIEERRPCCRNRGWSSWYIATSCSKSCGLGNKYLFRDCLEVRTYMGKNCSALRERKKIPCHHGDCSGGLRLHDISPWTDCTKSCDTGVRYRFEKCAYKDRTKCLQLIRNKSEICNDHPCPVDGGWSTWIFSGQCSVVCGGGKQFIHRECNYPLPEYGGEQCPGITFKEIDCNTHVCPVKPYWGYWSEFGKCSVTCGMGFKIRSRSCFSNKTKINNEKCSGQPEFLEKCEIDDCAKVTISPYVVAIIILSVLAFLGACISLAVFLRRSKKHPEFFTILEQ